jgi:hypothetical protein
VSLNNTRIRHDVIPLLHPFSHLVNFLNFCGSFKRTSSTCVLLLSEPVNFPSYGSFIGRSSRLGVSGEHLVCSSMSVGHAVPRNEGLAQPGPVLGHVVAAVGTEVIVETRG